MTPADLLAWRNRLGLSQSGAAARLNTPVDTYQNWEQGRRRIPGVVEVAMQAVSKETAWWCLSLKFEAG